MSNKREREREERAWRREAQEAHAPRQEPRREVEPEQVVDLHCSPSEAKHRRLEKWEHSPLIEQTSEDEEESDDSTRRLFTEETEEKAEQPSNAESSWAKAASAYHSVGNNPSQRQRPTTYSAMALSMQGAVTLLSKKAAPTLFYGTEHDDHDRHLKQFRAACSLNGENTDTEMIDLFPFTLRGEATEWFYDKGKTYTKFDELEKDFKGYYQRKFDRRDPVARLQEIYQGETEMTDVYGL